MCFTIKTCNKPAMVAEQSKIANFQIQEFDPGYWIGVRGTIAHWFDICLLHCGPGFESRRRRREMTKQIDRLLDPVSFRFVFRSVVRQTIAGRLSGMLM